MHNVLYVQTEANNSDTYKLKTHFKKKKKGRVHH